MALSARGSAWWAINGGDAAASAGARAGDRRKASSSATTRAPRSRRRTATGLGSAAPERSTVLVHAAGHRRGATLEHWKLCSSKQWRICARGP
mgnify:CR=1 FL=1